MDLSAINRHFFHLTHAFNTVVTSCGLRPFIDYDLTPSIHRKALEAMGNSPYPEFNDLITAPAHEKEEDRQQRLQQGLELAYHHLHDLWGACQSARAEIDRHPYGNAMLHKLNGVLIYAADQIKPQDQRMKPYHLYHSIMGVKWVGGDVLKNAYNYNSTLLDEAFSGMAFNPLNMASDDPRDINHAKGRQFQRLEDDRHRIIYDEDAYDLKTLIKGYIDNLTVFFHNRFCFGTAPFTFDVKLEILNEGEPGMHAWLSSKGNHFTYGVNLTRHLSESNSAQGKHDGTSKSLLANSSIHEGGHMQNLGNVAACFAHGHLPMGGELMTSLAPYTIIAPEAFAVEFIPAIGPLVWGYADSDRLLTNYNRAFLLRSFQKIHFGFAVDKMMGEEGTLEAASQFLIEDAKYTRRQPAKNIEMLTSMWDRAAGSSNGLLAPVYSQVGMEAMRLHQFAGHDRRALRQFVGDLMTDYLDVHGLIRKLEIFGKPYGYKPALEALPLPTSHPSLSELKQSIQAARQATAALTELRLLP